MTSCIDEYYKLKAQLSEPIVELETESSVNKKRISTPKPINMFDMLINKR